MADLLCRQGTRESASFHTFSRPSAVVDVSSGSSMFSALGPAMMLPSAVGVTTTPLEIGVGAVKRGLVIIPCRFLSKSQYSPLLGAILKPGSPTMEATLSACKPAAFTINDAFKALSLRITSKPSTIWAMSNTSSPSSSSTPFSTAFSISAMHISQGQV